MEDRKSNASVPVKLGHIYLVREAGRRNGNFEYAVKMKVIAYTAGQSVTIRWEMLAAADGGEQPGGPARTPGAQPSHRPGHPGGRPGADGSGQPGGPGGN